MKNMWILVTLGIALFAPTLIRAEEGFYVGAQGGVNFLHCHFLQERHCYFDTGYNLGVVAGYAWCNGWSLESEITYHDNRYRLRGTNEDGDQDTFHGHVDTWSFMTNGYYTIPFCTPLLLSPYVGAGIGADRVHQVIRISGKQAKGSNTGFAWQLMAGINRTIFQEIIMSLEYKFHASPLRHGHHLQNHSITLGFKKFFCFSF